MKRKRIVVMGFMGSMPIAGVIWQHVHYMVGLQRLGHDVYYIEDSARLPYNPETFEVSEDFGYAAKILSRLAAEFDFKDRWAYCARYLQKSLTAGISLKKIRQLYREADAILNICGAQEFNHDLLASDHRLYRAAPCPFHIRRKHRHEEFSGASARIQMVANAATDRDRSVENESFPCSRRRLHVHRELVHQRPEGHRLARQKISLE
jgi:hypothetical protein